MVDASAVKQKVKNMPKRSKALAHIPSHKHCRVCGIDISAKAEERVCKDADCIKKYEKEIDGMEDSPERDRIERKLKDMKSVKTSLEISKKKRRETEFQKFVRDTTNEFLETRRRDRVK